MDRVSRTKIQEPRFKIQDSRFKIQDFNAACLGSWFLALDSYFNHLIHFQIKKRNPR